jgi:hypothetical protein
VVQQNLVRHLRGDLDDARSIRDALLKFVNQMAHRGVSFYEGVAFSWRPPSAMPFLGNLLCQLIPPHLVLVIVHPIQYEFVFPLIGAKLHIPHLAPAINHLDMLFENEQRCPRVAVLLEDGDNSVHCTAKCRLFLEGYGNPSALIK